MWLNPEKRAYLHEDWGNIACCYCVYPQRTTRYSYFVHAVANEQGSTLRIAHALKTAATCKQYASLDSVIQSQCMK